MKVLAANPKARHDYQLLDTFEAGLELRGAEVKSIRAGNVSIKEAYVRINRDEAWLVGGYVKPYQGGAKSNAAPSGAGQSDATRTRKLLLHRRELAKLTGASREKSVTIVPLAIGLVRGYVKLEIALGRGKKLHDKRAALKAKEQSREADRAIRESLK